MIKTEKKSNTINYITTLDKFDDIILFKEKLERAKKILAKVGIPEKWRTQIEAK
jgi:hypothetical protein